MTIKFTQQKILYGLDLLIRYDGYLLNINANERSITHKLAEYYQYIFPEWNVDCEYNRDLFGPKKIIIDPQDILTNMADFIKSHYKSDALSAFLEKEFNRKDLEFLERELRNKENISYNEELDLIYFVLKLTNGKKIIKTIFPDIIIHYRGTQNNYVVIEAKKSSNISKESRLYDIVKLSALVNPKGYNYKQGYFIDIPIGTKDIAKFKGFKKPKKINKKVYQINPK